MSRLKVFMEEEGWSLGRSRVWRGRAKEESILKDPQEDSGGGPEVPTGWDGGTSLQSRGLGSGGGSRTITSLMFKVGL